ncbi:MAG: putative peptidoglycan glycosyltransferase FtsW [Alphaproteobacteria bacterium]
MMAFARNDTSALGRWWWTVDRWTLAALASLIAIGTTLTLAASPAVAQRIGLDSLHFVRRQFAYLPFAIAILVGVSLLSVRDLRRLAVIVFLVGLSLLAVTPWLGTEIKGATRWISLAGLSVQPSEFVKPAFAVVAAWMFSADRLKAGIPGNVISIGLYVLVVGLLVRQPDIGMVVVITVVWLTQFFLAGLPIFWVGAAAAGGVVSVAAAYLLLPHVASRIDRFLDPAAGDTYQISTALHAFATGGWFGRGPGEGRIKTTIPDSHSDFIFAVAGEEFGLILCVVIVALFGFVVLRGFTRLLREGDLFVVLATAGLLTQFGLQAIINMASTLSLMPTKGMTLPFISYGGSSLLALAFAMGMVLGFLRRRPETRGRP